MSTAILKSVTCSLCILNTIYSVSPFSISSRNINHFMRVIQIHSFGDASVLKLETKQVPEPKSNQVLVKVHGSGINPVDVQVREKAFGYVPPLPLILGKEAAGVVEDIGNSVKTFKKGERVVCCLPYDGGYAEYVTCNVTDVIPLPSPLSFAQGAAIYVAYYTAYRALITKLKIKKGELALIHGASGAVGIAGVQIAKAHGLKVVGTAGSEQGLKVVKDVGADVVVDHREDGHLKQALNKIGSRGFDVVLENRASCNLGSDMASLNHSGRIAIVGSRGPVQIDPRFLISTEGFVVGIKMTAVTHDEFTQYTHALLKGIEDGWLRPVVANEYEFSENGARQAHTDIMNEHGAHGKLVFTVSA